MAFSILEHEYSLDNGVTWQNCAIGMDNGDGTATIPIGNNNVPVGHLQVRVKASGSRPAGQILYNTVAFNATVVETVTYMDTDYVDNDYVE